MEYPPLGQTVAKFGVHRGEAGAAGAATFRPENPVSQATFPPDRLERLPHPARPLVGCDQRFEQMGPEVGSGGGNTTLEGPARSTLGPALSLQERATTIAALEAEQAK